ncbi:MAG: ABC transporter permease [Rhizobiaceae bacterium]
MSGEAGMKPDLAAARPVGRTWRGLKAFLRNMAGTRHGAAGCAILLLLAAVAVFAPLIAPYDPLQQAQASLAPPSAQNLFGTNNTGQDIFSLVLYGTRTSLAIGLGAAFGALVLGGIVGMLAGYFRGAVEALLMRVAELFQTLPVIVVVLFTVALFGSSFWLLLAAIILAIWPVEARLVYGQYIRLRGMDFVAAAKVADLSTAHIILREILPTAIRPVVVQVALDASVAILIEAGLGFLGLSDPNVVSWGQLLYVAQDYMTLAWWTSFFPGAAICLAVVGLNLFADGLNEIIDPRTRGRAGGLQS